MHVALGKKKQRGYVGQAVKQQLRLARDTRVALV